MLPLQPKRGHGSCSALTAYAGGTITRLRGQCPHLSFVACLRLLTWLAHLERDLVEAKDSAEDLSGEGLIKCHQLFRFQAELIGLVANVSLHDISTRNSPIDRNLLDDEQCDFLASLFSHFTTP